MTKNIPEHHVLQALEGYLKSMSMIDDDAIVVSVKRNRDGSFEIEVEND